MSTPSTYPQPPSIAAWFRNEHQITLLQSPEYFEPKMGAGLSLAKPAPLVFTPEQSEKVSVNALPVRELTLKPGQAVPFHLNREKSKLYYVVEGKAFFLGCFEGKIQQQLVRPGDEIIGIEPGAWHAVANPGPGDVRIRIILTNTESDLHWSDEGDQLLMMFRKLNLRKAE